MPVNRLKPFAAALAGASLLAAGMVPAASHAESLQDVFTQEELDTLFGEGAQIPKYIGPHRVVISLEEARQIEGQAIPVIIWAIGARIVIGGAAGAYISSQNGANPYYGAAVGGLAGGLAGGVGHLASGAGVWGGVIGAGAGAGTAALCYVCHQSK